jgi:hypothetical protein
VVETRFNVTRDGPDGRREQMNENKMNIIQNLNYRHVREGSRGFPVAGIRFPHEIFCPIVK